MKQNLPFDGKISALTVNFNIIRRLKDEKSPKMGIGGIESFSYFYHMKLDR